MKKEAFFLVRKPTRLILAQLLCRWLPPIIAQRVRELIYPKRLGIKDDFLFRERAQTGSWLEHRTSDYHGHTFAVHGYFDWRNWAVATALLKRGDVVIEIGANIGTETIVLADIVGPHGRIYAFEPVPEHVQALRRLVELNHFRQVVLIPKAVGSTRGMIRFAKPPNKHMSGVEHIAYAESRLETFEVACETLDELDLPPARAIFMDVEGAEIEVISGGKRWIAKYRPILVLEVGPKQLKRFQASPEDMYVLLVELGYSMYRLKRRHFILEPVNQHDLPTKTENWLCLPVENDSMKNKVRRTLIMAGLLPCIRGINPISRWPSRQRMRSAT